MVFIKRGEIFVTSVEYTTTKQITHTAAAERQITWSPDNRTIAYTSERDGHWNIYKATIAREEDRNFPNATLINEEPLFSAKDKVERTYPSFSPDGNELAFIQDRNKLMVMNIKTKKCAKLPTVQLMHAAMEALPTLGLLMENGLCFQSLTINTIHIAMLPS